MVGWACPLPRSDFFYTRIDVMAPVRLLLTSTLLSRHPGSCEDGAGELILPRPHLPLLKSALCPLAQVSSLLIYQDSQVNKIEDYLFL